MLRFLNWCALLGLLIAAPAWAQSFKMPDQKPLGVPAVRLATSSRPGSYNTPVVSTSGGNATATLTTKCAAAGCTDFENIINGGNSGTLTLTCPTTLVTGQFVYIFVFDSGTAPSDVLFATCSGSTYQSLQPGILAANITGVSGTDKQARVTSCGAPPLTGALEYNFLFDGTNLTLTGCSGFPGATFISPGLIQGAQWKRRAVVGPINPDTVLAADTVIEDNPGPGNITEQLPACTANNAGKLYIFKRVPNAGVADNGINSVTITPFAGDNIDTLASVTVSGPAAEYAIRCSSTAGTWSRQLPIPWSHQFGGTDVTAVGSLGQYLTSNGSNFAVLSRPVRPGFNFAGTVGVNSVLAYTCLETLNFPVSLAGSYPDANAAVTCGTNPGQTDTYTVKVAGASKGTFTVSTSCAGTFTGIASGFACQAGQRLEIDGPASFSVSAPADVAVSLGGHTP